MVDFDSVVESNLNRQFLFGDQHQGLNKAKTARDVLHDTYPRLEIKAFAIRLDPLRYV